MYLYVCAYFSLHSHLAYAVTFIAPITHSRSRVQYNVFLFMILGFTLLSIIYFSIFPSDRDHLNKVMASIKAKKGAEFKSFERKIAQQGGSLELATTKGKGKK